VQFRAGDGNRQLGVFLRRTWLYSRKKDKRDVRVQHHALHVRLLLMLPFSATFRSRAGFPFWYVEDTNLHATLSDVDVVEAVVPCVWGGDAELLSDDDAPVSPFVVVRHAARYGRGSYRNDEVLCRVPPAPVKFTLEAERGGPEFDAVLEEARVRACVPYFPRESDARFFDKLTCRSKARVRERVARAFAQSKMRDFSRFGELYARWSQLQRSIQEDRSFPPKLFHVLHPPSAMAPAPLLVISDESQYDSTRWKKVERMDTKRRQGSTSFGFRFTYTDENGAPVRLQVRTPEDTILKSIYNKNDPEQPDHEDPTQHRLPIKLTGLNFKRKKVHGKIFSVEIKDPNPARFEDEERLAHARSITAFARLYQRIEKDLYELARAENKKELEERGLDDDDAESIQGAVPMNEQIWASKVTPQGLDRVNDDVRERWKSEKWWTPVIWAPIVKWTVFAKLNPVTGKVGNANFKEDLFYGDDARGVASLAFGYVSCTPEMVTARGDLLMVKIKPRAEREEPGVGSKRSLEVLKALNGGVDVELASDDDEDADEDAAPATTTTAGGYDPSIFVPPPEEEPAAKRSRREPSAPPSPPLAEEVAAEDGADVPEAVAV